MTNLIIPIPEETTIYKWFYSIGYKHIIAKYDYIMKKTFFCFLPKHNWNPVTNVCNYELIRIIVTSNTPDFLVYLYGEIKDWQKADNEFFEKYSGKSFYFILDNIRITVPDMLEVAIISSM